MIKETFNEKSFNFNESFSKININLNNNFENRYIKPEKRQSINQLRKKNK